jgi:L-2-hydroxycarboxylate dehydrogenase (NAD+)
MKKQLLYKPDDLQEYIIRYFSSFNFPVDDAQIIAKILLSADLRGIHTHGVMRIPTYYNDWLQDGYVSPRASLTTLRETASMLSLDGENSMGHVVAYRAMQRCIEKAGETGIGVVTVRNSNHYGIAGYYAMMALEHEMIGISLTNARPWIAPTYSRQAMLGTNPIAVAVPAGEEYPFVLDMATSVVPQGLLVLQSERNQNIPRGWGIDNSGEVTDKPKAVLNGGALNPLGGTESMRSYKGYGLALMVEIFTGILAGADFSTNITSPDAGGGLNIGHFFAALRIDALRPLEAFKLDIDQLLQRLKNAPKTDGENRIFIHGEKEFEKAKRHTREGIPLFEEIVELLEKTGLETGTPFDLLPLGEKYTRD